MAYPTIDKPYGYKPVNLIGGQPFAGSTRMYPVVYNNTSAIYYGDPVTLSNGNVVIATLPVNSTNTIIGFFLGCYYTNPATKQRLYSQYLPANTLAGDITAVVADDPDIVLRCAVTATTNSQVVSSANTINIGTNMVGNSGATIVGSIATGNSANGVLASTSAGASTAGFRVLQLATDTQVSYGGTYVSQVAATSVTIAGLPSGVTIPVGAEVFNVVFGGLQYTGAFVGTATTTTSANTVLPVGTTTGLTTTVGASLAVVVTPEVLVKVNFGVHRYNIA